jgi:hypothetical protein
MESVPLYLTILMGSLAATGSGILYWMAMENMRDTKHRGITVFLLSVILSPAGAWVVSTIYQLVHVSGSSHSAS